MKNKEVEEKNIKLQEEMDNFCRTQGKPLLIQDFKITAIGWLDSSEPFEKGEVPAGFIDRLKLLWDEGLTLATLGFHECEFCKDKKTRSSREKILIDRENKVKYIFPEMIFHYIKEHKFKPSDNFVEFVMRE